MKAFELGGGIPMWMTFSDFQAWFFVYSASTSSGSSLDSRTNGSRSGLVLAQQHGEELDKASQKRQGENADKEAFRQQDSKQRHVDITIMGCAQLSLYQVKHDWPGASEKSFGLLLLPRPLVCRPTTSYMEMVQLHMSRAIAASYSMVQSIDWSNLMTI